MTMQGVKFWAWSHVIKDHDSPSRHEFCLLSVDVLLSLSLIVYFHSRFILLLAQGEIS